MCLVCLLGLGFVITTVTARGWAAPTSPSATDTSATAVSSEAQSPVSKPSDPGVSESGVVPPRPILTKVDAPEEPLHRVGVLLELLVDESGRVEQVHLLDGPEPFAHAALDAAPGFTFEPALRHGRATAARIRFLVRFEPKEPISIPASPSARTSVQTPNKKLAFSPPPRSKVPLEVVVTAMRPAYTTGIVTRSETREIPGTFGDPLRAVEGSAGVSPIYSGVPFFFVRGAPPGNIGFFLDGVRVPLLYHAVLGPSVVHPALIDRVELHRGAAPPNFGRYAGAIVNAETRSSLSRAGGEANVRLFDAGGLVETPFAGGRGHALVGGRYSYTALLVSLLSNVEVQYWDYQTRVEYETSRRGKLSVFAFGAYDRFAVPNADTETSGGTQFHRVDLRYDIETSRTKTRLAVTTGYDRTASNSGALKDHSIAFRGLTHHRLHERLTFVYGSDIIVDRYSLRIDNATAEAPDVSVLFPNRTDVVGSVFTELNYAPTKWITLAPGLRADAYRISGATAFAFDPRFATTIHPNRTLYCAYSIGATNQPPNYVPQVPAAAVGTLTGGLQRALSMSTTVGAHLPYDFSASVTGFHSEYYNLLDPIGRARDFSFDPNILSHRQRGIAYGLEFELRRAITKRIGGFVSATLSRTERSKDAYESLSAYDRMFVLTAALGVDLGYRIRAGARLAYYSGIPGHIYDGPVPRYDGSRRSSPYYRADLRLERRWPIAGRGYWALVAEMLNATMAKEITSHNCGTVGCSDEVSGPIAIPSIGFEIYSY